METKGGVCSRELQNPRFTSLLQGKPKIGRGLTTTEVRERNGSREEGEGATGALSSPRTFTGGNGGSSGFGNGSPNQC